MADTFENRLGHGGNFDVFPCHHEQIHVQFALRHILHGGAQGSDVVPEVRKGFGDPEIVPNENFQLVGQCLGRSSPVALLAGDFHHLIHDLVQPFAFQIHRLNGFRINLVQFVIPEAVRLHAGQHQQFTVDLVQPEDAVLHLFQDRAHLAHGNFHPDGMTAFCQPETERIPLLVAQGTHFPAGIVGEGDCLQVFKRHFIVNIDRPSRQGAALVYLPCLDGNVVIPVFRHLEIPLDPFTGMGPGFPADIIQDRVCQGIRHRLAGTAVISGIQTRSAAKGGGFALYGLAVIFRRFRAGIFRLGGCIFRVGRALHDRRQRYAAEDHRLVHGADRQVVLPFVEIKSVRLCLVAHVVHAVSALLLIAFHLGGTDIVPLVVLADFALVGPQARKAERAGSGEGYFPVDRNFTLNVDSAAFHRQVVQADIVQTGLGNLNLPGQVGFLFGQQAFGAHFPALSFKSSKIHLHGLADRGQIRVPFQVGCVCIAAADTGHVRRQVDALILILVILGCPAEQPGPSDHKDSGKGADEEIPPFS